jgi:hypothetical protein
MIVAFLYKMNDDVFDAVECLCVEKVKGVVRGRQMTIHAIGHESLGVVHVGGRLPGIVSKLDFVTACTKGGCGCPDHGVIGQAEKGKGDNQTEDNENSWFDEFLHRTSSLLVLEKDLFSPLCLGTGNETF